MEGLQDIANDEWRLDNLFHEPSAPLKIIEIATSVDGRRELSSSFVPENDLLATLNKNAYERTINEVHQSGCLQLIRIPRADDAGLWVSRHVYYKLLAHFCIDPFASYLLGRNSYGLRHVPPMNGTSTHTFFLGSVLYMLMWSYDLSKHATNVVVLPRSSNHYGGKTVIPEELERLLTRYKDHSHHPNFIPFITCLQMVGALDRELLVQQSNIREIENETGHGAWRRHARDANERLSMTKILDLSSEVGAHNVNIANDARHYKIAESLLSFLWQGIKPYSPCSVEDSQAFDTSETLFQTALVSLKAQVETGKDSVLFLQERLKSQSTVLFNLLTHKDSTINIEVAAASKEIAEASNRLALATQRDSSAMKTIAVMTMLFLPATFFAALFAVPSLKWDQPSVIQDNFWIYWAFVIPATALILIVWMFLTNYEFIVEQVHNIMRSRRKRSLEKD